MARRCPLSAGAGETIARTGPRAHPRAGVPPTPYPRPFTLAWAADAAPRRPTISLMQVERT